tara:strand:- start:592 stop:1464 length:873 start_codon:yes stop_codon:yes gene_type:complete
MKISQHIFNLLRDQDCVIIPNFGAFVCRYKSAKISSDKSKIFPPNKEISFNKSLIKNDGLLINSISSQDSLSYEEAAKKLNNWVTKIVKKLKNNESIEIKNIGSLMNKDSKYIFNPDLNSIILKGSFGLKVVESSELLKSNNKSNNSYLKYAAILIVLVSLTSIFSKSYFDSIKEYNEASFTQANKQIEQKIQKATFSINTDLPMIKLPIKKQYGSFHIIAGSFRLEENSLKLVSQLKEKGFIESRKVGINKFGLFQVAYNSYDNVEEARYALDKIRSSEDINAWLLVKN